MWAFVSMDSLAEFHPPEVCSTVHMLLFCLPENNFSSETASMVASEACRPLSWKAAETKPYKDSLCGRITGSGLRSCRERRPHMTMGETHLGKGFYFLKHAQNPAAGTQRTELAHARGAPG
ncbi:uncharacterized protein LOC143441420 [Arvicanthis niloticus]|uniref:uncharacterized protein LOC143311637 n=1 Tax=Arvicanthis niloticus TaxID=61156 RepID=UPI00402B1335